MRWFLLVNVFGANKRHKQDHLRAHEEAHASLDQLLLGPSDFLRTIVRGIQEQGPNLVSFSDSIVDQNPWERAATPIIQHDTGSITGDASSVEVSLFALIRTFVGNVALPSLFGREFLDYYPETLDDIQDLDGMYTRSPSCLLQKCVPRLETTSWIGNADSKITNSWLQVPCPRLAALASDSVFD